MSRVKIALLKATTPGWLRVVKANFLELSTEGNEPIGSRENGHSTDKPKLLVSNGSTNGESLKAHNKKKQMSEGIESEGLETQIMDRTLRENRLIEEELKNEYSYINCDVRYFNFDFLTSHLGFFDGRSVSF